MLSTWISRSLSCLTLGTLMVQAGVTALGGVSAGQGDNLVLPQMFNLTSGDSTVILQNLSAAQQDINVEFFSQDGSFFDLITATLAGMGEAQVPTPAGPAGGFVGSVLIFGNAPYAARGQWNFNVGGTQFAVGVPTIPVRDASTTFQMPVGTVGANSLVGVAIENPGATTINCTVTYRDQNGQSVAEDAFPIAGFGQISEFASGIGAGFEGSGTVTCNNGATVAAVIQHQINGFPTPLFAVAAN